jgi:hypothetical protein
MYNICDAVLDYEPRKAVAVGDVAVGKGPARKQGGVRAHVGRDDAFWSCPVGTIRQHLDVNSCMVACLSTTGRGLAATRALGPYLALKNGTSSSPI